MKRILIISSFLLILSSCDSNIENKEHNSEGSILSVEKQIKLENNHEIFDDFLKYFMNDSVFQLNRIKFPINGEYKDFDTIIQWTKENWRFINSPYTTVDTNDYTIKWVKEPSEIMEEIQCKECGYYFSMRFKLVDNKWFLTCREENNY